MRRRASEKLFLRLPSSSFHLHSSSLYVCISSSPLTFRNPLSCDLLSIRSHQNPFSASFEPSIDQFHSRLRPLQVCVNLSHTWGNTTLVAASRSRFPFPRRARRLLGNCGAFLHRVAKFSHSVVDAVTLVDTVARFQFEASPTMCRRFCAGFERFRSLTRFLAGITEWAHREVVASRIFVRAPLQGVPFAVKPLRKRKERSCYSVEASPVVMPRVFGELFGMLSTEPWLESSDLVCTLAFRIGPRFPTPWTQAPCVNLSSDVYHFLFTSSILYLHFV